MDHLLSQIEFIREIDKLKYIFRKTKLINSDRPENDAEHSWHLAVMVIVLAGHSNESVDLAKVMKRLEYWKSGDCSFLDFTEKFGEFTRKWLRRDSNDFSR